MPTPASLPQPVVEAFRRNLVRWFINNQRSLPWRRNRTPYRVWVAECMLQQTRVEQAIPYYKKFLRTFPSLRSLAVATEQQALKVWEGLGYYSRVRRMQQTARHLVETRSGRFPRTVDGLQKLPGIGVYTAAAVGSLAFGIDRAVVDGNVTRVLSRVMALKARSGSGPARKRIHDWAQELLPRGRSARFNEAVMELGALVCLPRNPACHRCPLKEICKGYETGRPEQFPCTPVKKKIPHKVVGAGVIVNRKKRILIAQRRPDSMLGGLWEFPGGTREKNESIRQCICRELREELGIGVELGPFLMTVRHAYSHFTMDMKVYWARIKSGRPVARECADYRWVRVEDMGEYPFSKADLKVIVRLKQTAMPSF